MEAVALPSAFTSTVSFRTPSRKNWTLPLVAPGTVAVKSAAVLISREVGPSTVTALALWATAAARIVLFAGAMVGLTIAKAVKPAMAARTGKRCAMVVDPR